MHDQMNEAGCASLKAREALLGMTWLRRSGALLASCAAIVLSCLCASATAQASTLPQGFYEQTVFSGLTDPTAIRFSPDGRVFVAEKSGLIKVFDSLCDHDADRLRRPPHATCTTSGTAGCSAWRWIPSFPPTPYVYVLYTYDAAIGGTAPRWGAPGATSDGCPTRRARPSDGCVVSGRLVAPARPRAT